MKTFRRCRSLTPSRSATALTRERRNRTAALATRGSPVTSGSARASAALPRAGLPCAGLPRAGLPDELPESWTLQIRGPHRPPGDRHPREIGGPTETAAEDNPARDDTGRHRRRRRSRPDRSRSLRPDVHGDRPGAVERPRSGAHPARGAEPRDPRRRHSTAAGRPGSRCGVGEGGPQRGGHRGRAPRPVPAPGEFSAPGRCATARRSARRGVPHPGRHTSRTADRAFGAETGARGGAPAPPRDIGHPLTESRHDRVAVR